MVNYPFIRDVSRHHLRWSRDACEAVYSESLSPRGQAETESNSWFISIFASICPLVIKHVVLENPLWTEVLLGKSLQMVHFPLPWLTTGDTRYHYFTIQICPNCLDQSMTFEQHISLGPEVRMGDMCSPEQSGVCFAEYNDIMTFNIL